MPRRLSIVTELDYDGQLPGGYVEGLSLHGQLDVRLYKDRQVLDFRPGNSPIVTLKHLETPTSWRGEDISFTLGPTRNLFIRNTKASTLAATLQKADLSLIQMNRPTDATRHFDLRSESIALTGTLQADRIQDWAVEFTDADYVSDTLPGPNTTAFANQASLTARLTPDQAPQITLDAPSITAETPLVRLADMRIALTGTPENYEVIHDSGMIFIIHLKMDFIKAEQNSMSLKPIMRRYASTTPIKTVQGQPTLMCPPFSSHRKACSHKVSF